MLSDSCGLLHSSHYMTHQLSALHIIMQDDKLIDPFVVHDPHYSAMRETVDEAVYTAKGQINQGSLVS